MESPGIAVIGSNNIDLVTRVERMPRLGETLEAVSFSMGYGGKGANQAVAAARLGSRVLMLTRMGDDIFGPGYLRHLEEQGIDMRHAETVPGVSSGVAPIFVDGEANNSILIVKGANNYLLPADVDRAADDLRRCRMIILQLEIPLETVYRAIEFGAENGIPVILNPAPAMPLDFNRIRGVSFLVPNETELEILSGAPVRSVREAETAAAALLEKGLANVIVTLGAKGALWLGPGGSLHIPAFPAECVDTTGAGDAFIASFAHHLLKLEDVEEALRMANRYAALSTTRPGAQSAMPDAAEFAGALERRPE